MSIIYESMRTFFPEVSRNCPVVEYREQCSSTISILSGLDLVSGSYAVV